MRNIIITGGGLTNKGAQAMTFIAVYELKKRYPHHRIYVLSEEDKQRSDNEKNIYLFDFIGWYPQKFAKCQGNPVLKLLCTLVHRKEYSEFLKIYKNCDLMIDISGYAFGSNWGRSINTAYLDNFEFAKALNIPLYIMPQTFGPFDFNGKYGYEIVERAKSLFSYAKVVCAREKESFDLLTNKLNLNNVILSNDLVLCYKSIDVLSVYKKKPIFYCPEICAQSVGIIPNNRNSSVGGDEKSKALYKDCINICLSRGYTIYILSHSSVDFELCQELKREFSDNRNVILLENEFSCLEFNDIVGKFSFLIASRFHSIVHAYKNHVPCVVLGWAEKYRELLSLFGQGQFMFDIRDNINSEDLNNVIDHMINSTGNEKEKLARILTKVQENNIFDILPATLEKK